MNTVFFFTCGVTEKLVVWHGTVLSISFYRKDTSNERSSRSVSPDFQSSADHSCPVVHDVETHTLDVRRIRRNARAIILYLQRSLPCVRPTTGSALLRVAALDRIVHGFLRDVERCVAIVSS